MKLKLGFFLLAFGVVAQAAPDLIVSSFRVTGAPRVLPSGNVTVPVQVALSNRGVDIAGRFKIHAEARATGSDFYVVPLQPVMGATSDSGWYAWTVSALFPGRTVSFTANVLFTRVWRGKTVALRAFADSCSGEEFMPSYCRIHETVETNNDSTSRSIFIP